MAKLLNTLICKIKQADWKTRYVNARVSDLRAMRDTRGFRYARNALCARY